jgi:hypothetical protein
MSRWPFARGAAPSPTQPSGLDLPSPALRERVPSVARRVRVFAGIALCVLPLALAGCGKRNAPQPPPDVPNTYPRPYPSE